MIAFPKVSFSGGTLAESKELCCPDLACEGPMCSAIRRLLGLVATFMWRPSLCYVIKASGTYVYILL